MSKQLRTSHPAGCLDFGGASPQVSPGTFVARSATLIGRVTLSHGASVWFGAVLRADLDAITVGANTNIQDGCVIHADPGFPVNIGDGVSVGHRAVIHGASIGHDVLVGMGAIILNGARIDPHCIIGAGAVVREGQHIPEGSLVVGVPGRVVRSIDDAAQTLIAHRAEDYLGLAAAYRAMA